MIEAKNLSWSIGEKSILNDISVSISTNEVVALIGPNGCGKSSLIKLLSGLRAPHSGDVELHGANLQAMKKKDVARHIAVVEQESKSPVSMTAKDVVMLGRTPYWQNWQRGGKQDEEIVHECLDKVGLSHYRDRNWKALSGGERQRVQLARALAQDTDFLILDEPTNHLDIHHQHEFLGLLQDMNKGCLVSLHDLNLTSIYSDRAIILSNGQVDSIGETQSVLTTDVIERTYAVTCRCKTCSLDDQKRFHFREINHV